MQVRLPDLEVIKRFSIAVRREHATADEVIAALEADLARLRGRGPSRTAEPRSAEPAPTRAQPRREATAKPASGTAKRKPASTRSSSGARRKSSGSTARGRTRR